MTSLVLMLGIGAMTQNLTFLSLELAPSAQLPGSDAPGQTNLVVVPRL